MVPDVPKRAMWPLYAAGFTTAFGALGIAANLGSSGDVVSSLLVLGGLLALYDGAEVVLKPVFGSLADRVGGGFVKVRAPPGGTATGFMLFEYGMGGKWPELLKQTAPRVTRAAVLRGPANPGAGGPRGGRCRCRPRRWGALRRWSALRWSSALRWASALGWSSLSRPGAAPGARRPATARAPTR